MWFLQPIEWTTPAYVVASYAGLLILTGLVLLVPLAFGKRDGFYKSYAPVLSDEGAVDLLRILEMEMGAHFIVWGWSAVGALMAGGNAQTICICQLAPLLFLVRYFCTVDAKFCGVSGVVFVLTLGYCGFVPMPAPPSVAGELALIFGLLQGAVILLVALSFIAGKAAKLYEDQPLTKQFMSDGDTPVYERELLMGTTLLGIGFGVISASVTGAAINFCVIAGPAYFVTGGVHWIGSGDKKNAMNNFVIAVVYLCIGFVAHAIQ
jgi:hypothetical protein